MRLDGYFLDGEWAQRRRAIAALTGSPENGMWEIIDGETHETLTRWPAPELLRKPARKGALRLSAKSAPLGARFVLTDKVMIAEAEAAMPALTRQHRRHRATQLVQLSAATVLLARGYRPLCVGHPARGAATDRRHADGVGKPISAARSPASSRRRSARTAASFHATPIRRARPTRAISQFVTRVLGDRTPPFPIEVMVGHSQVPNAFAIPGGQIYYLSALLDDTRNGEEFAGVLAHEMGHVMHRHAMQNVISAAGTGLVIGFVLGDMTGVSLAAVIGSAIIDSRHSREAEREADIFAAEAAKRLGFAPNALPDLLDRIAGDGSDAAMLALLSSHPLTIERRQYLDQSAKEAGPSGPAFTFEEWEAIRTMCDDGSGSAADRE